MRLLIYWGLFFCLATATVAQDGEGLRLEEEAAAAIEESLLEQGFEYVAAEVTGPRAVVTYENRVYRYEVRALVEVLEQVIETVPGIEFITLIPQSRGIALASVMVPAAAYSEYLQGALSEEAFAEHFRSTRDVNGDALNTKRRHNPATFKLDFFVQPQLAAQFGSFEDAVRSQVNVVPEVEVGLWRGMRLAGQLIIPLQNELEEEDDYVRPGLLVASQVVRLPYNTFAATTLGYFTDRRYGLDSELRTYFLEGRTALGVRIGRTGYATFDRGEWLYSGLDATTYSAQALYHLSSYNLTMHVDYGRFLFGDQGWRVELQRRFGEVEIGFFGFYTDDGRDAGFRLAVPLPVARYMRPRRVRARPARAFRWEYRYRNLPGGGQLYWTGNELDRFLGGLVPSFAGGLSASLVQRGRSLD